jgi:hypothetical protein
MKIRLSIADASGGPTERECAGPVVRIGRAPDCELPFPEDATSVVSRNHARVELTAGGAMLTDMGSSNGTLHNDRKIAGPVPLRVGDRIRLGKTGPTLTVLELDLRGSSPQLVRAEAKKARVVHGEPAIVTGMDSPPYQSGPWSVDPQPEKGISRPGAVHQPFALMSRGTWILLAVAILLVVGGTGTLAYVIFRPQVYGRYGGIEIGATGLKMFAAEFFRSGNTWNYHTLVNPKDKNVHLGTKRTEKRQTFAPERLKDTIDFVESSFAEIQKSGVPPDRIYVICSSGVLAGFADKAKLDNGMVLRNEVKRIVDEQKAEKDGVAESELDFLDEADKAQYDLLACSAEAKDKQDSLLIHIGGGDTKGGSFNRKNVFEPMVPIPGYTKYEQEVNRIRKERIFPSFDEAARGLGNEILVPRIKEGIERRKGLNDRRKVYLLGALPWAMATYMHPDKLGERHIRLRASEIKQFRNWAARYDSNTLRRLALDRVAGKQTEPVEKEIDSVQNVFFKTQLTDTLIAGAEILADLSEEYNFDGKKLDFYHDGQYACIIGYIVKRAGIEK